MQCLPAAVDGMTDNAPALWETLILIGKTFSNEIDYIGAGPMFAKGIDYKWAEKNVQGKDNNTIIFTV